MSSAQDNLIRKLGTPAAKTSFVMNMPSGYILNTFLQSIDQATEIVGEADWIQLFSQNKQSLQANVTVLKQKLSKTGKLWICWPKKTSQTKSELNDTIVRQIGLKAGLVDTKVASINEEWSGLQFVFRLKDR